MKKHFKRAFCLAAVMALFYVALAHQAPQRDSLPQGFVYVSEVIPDVLLDIRYYSAYNFVGARVEGYLAPVAILTFEAAQALKGVSEELRTQGYLLKIYDAYRPQKAVDHFVRWAEALSDTIYRRAFYPDLDKSVLFDLGYISERSGHSRGSVVDLTIVEIATGKEVDMGAPFDFFGSVSGHGTSLITAEQTANREVLKNAMIHHGFSPYSKEWWHYNFSGEPFPNTYFDFDVK